MPEKTASLIENNPGRHPTENCLGCSMHDEPPRGYATVFRGEFWGREDTIAGCCNSGSAQVNGGSSYSGIFSGRRLLGEIPDDPK